MVRFWGILVIAKITFWCLQMVSLFIPNLSLGLNVL